ncbi:MULTISPECIES: hypothetical protein [Neisseria]|uniref:hypothetical protein n=1 Tax=Neisseria TaxID=482 RepID=UPI0012416A98|nr:hypothetical protein [Neisseria flavescens]
MLSGGLAKAELPAVRTGLGFIDRKLGGFLELGSYAYQMKLIGTGNTPQPKRSAWAELFRLLKNIRQHRLRSERA